MELHKGYLFHDRYLLIQKLGSGASANVWCAQDTKANNLMVALKIFTNSSDLDTYGIQNFEREFTSVYNMKHSNLLPPTGYDIYAGCPYLVMQYCENGSCSSMVGRCSEEEVIRFLHDVASGLEYLHAHNMIHQDIKPDNILLDDNCNFLVTDFGISVVDDNGMGSHEEMTGGTRAYMGPERFKGDTVSASDIWSLGATAYELIAGDPPYGDHGGLLQTNGEALPELPSTLQPEVRNIILSCLDENPERRITAAEIRQKIEMYNETGSWYKQNNRNFLMMGAAALLSILVCVGIYLWDSNRVKVHYYKDYSEQWGVPQGIGRVGSADVAKRLSTYCFEYKNRRLVRLSLVNSRGKVVQHSDTEHMNSRFSDVRYSYTDDGKINYAIVYNPEGRCLFKMDYDEHSVTFKHNDEVGTEKNLDANRTQLHKSSNIFDSKSPITRYLLKYDDNGRLLERYFVGFQNVKVSDGDGIYGQRYVYDEKGRVIEEQFLGQDYTVCGNNIGLAIKQYTYDENDNWVKVTYLDASRAPSHDGQNCSVVDIEYDEYDNRICETYLNADGTAAMRTDFGASGFRYTVADGLLMEQCLIDSDGNAKVGNCGVAIYAFEYDENGFQNKISYFDANRNPVRYISDGSSYSQIRSVNNNVGQWLEYTSYDEHGDKLTNEYGFFKGVREYDSIGNCISSSYFDEEGAPALYLSVYHKVDYTYDSFGNLIMQQYYDTNGKLVLDEMGVAVYKSEFNRQGALTKFEYYGTNNERVYNKEGFSYLTIDYDDIGNRRKMSYFNKDGKPVLSSDGYASTKYEYDAKTSLLVSRQYYDEKNVLVKETKYTYDNRGNIVKQYEVDKNGKLLSNTAVEVYEYNNLNQETSLAYYDLNNKKINRPGYKYHKITWVYDKYGNAVEQSYWTADNKAAVDENGTNKRIRKFDQMNRIVYEKNLGKDGKPVNSKNANVEGVIEYDNFGNICMMKHLDGYGKPSLSADGFHIMRREFNNRNKEVRKYYLGVKEEPIEPKEEGYYKVETMYDSRGNDSIAYFYNKKDKCFKIHEVKYNSKDRVIEFLVYDGDKRPDDETYAFHRYTVTYDDTDVVPQVRKYYTKDGKLLASQKYNKSAQDWGELEFANTGSSGSSSSSSSSHSSSSDNSSSDWRQVIRDTASECPAKLDDNITLLSLSVSGNTVTMVLKLVEISKYNLSSSDVESLKDVIKNETAKTMREILSLPKNVKMAIVLVDKAEREICKI